MKLQVSQDVTDLEVIPDPLPTSKRTRHKQWGGVTIGLFLGLLALALGRAGQLWPAMDLAAQFGAQALCLILGCAIAAFLPRFKALAGLILTGIFLISYGMWPILASQSLSKGPFSLAPGERAARLVQFNVWSKNQSPKAVADEIIRLDADVVSLEEMGTSKREILFRLRTAYPFQYACAEIQDCQFAVISRVPILAASAEMQGQAPPLLRARMGGRLAGLTVITVHTLRFPFSRRQLAQASALVKRLESETGHLVVMGDFNATPFSRVTSLLTESTGMKRLTSMPTWPAWAGLPQVAIDHVFVSRDIKPLAAAQIGQSAGSDHFPVVVNVAIPAS